VKKNKIFEPGCRINMMLRLLRTLVLHNMQQAKGKSEKKGWINALALHLSFAEKC